ncbi:hypothetical protein [endosymbiont GvMRE of Glomus versiforme]|uniref:hypothetical protein n=1 Tax=endosymbiont GvMRE of Glomus versiforme TaxID=2039283 RepID=UPI000EDE5701|nr:hypothetical protein [endosymbiont GvMRE of Glomus versiforme]RHZ37423.1 hypothetical protein GvMRE_I1g734 [endosymbiont GvMRE of Glomus versiforme]
MIFFNQKVKENCKLFNGLKDSFLARKRIFRFRKKQPKLAKIKNHDHFALKGKLIKKPERERERE